MSRPALVFLLLLAVPGLVSAASRDLSARGWLDQVPPLPKNTSQAYAQWKDGWEQCQPLTYGARWQNLHDSLKAREQEAAHATMASPSMQNARSLAQQYGTPEAQARMAKMSPAQLMALAQKMQQQMGQNQMAAGPVSEHDSHILDLFDKSTQTEGRVQQEQAAFTSNKLLPLMQAWDSELGALGNQDLKPLQLDQKTIQIDNKYLGKMAALAQEIRAIEMPALDAADAVQTGWTQIESPALKQRMATQERNASTTVISHVAVVASVIENASKKAADDEAKYKHDQITLPNGDNRTCN